MWWRLFLLVVFAASVRVPVRMVDRSTVNRLNDLFYEGTGPSISPGGVIRNLPLWRVQWNAIPGGREVYNVHVPHYTHMFEELLRSEKPWLFGHSYLPGGSANLRNEAYALRSGTKAALTGTLMELVEAKRAGDGRLCLVAQGVGRFRVTNVTRTVPHFAVEASLVLDDEEVRIHGDDAAGVALRWRHIEYPSRDIVCRDDIPMLRVPELAPVAPAADVLAPKADVDRDLADLELRVWVALVRCHHLLIQCLKKQNIVAEISLPENVLVLQPPNVAAKLLVGADSLGPAPRCPLPAHRRAMRFSFVALTALSTSFLDQAAPFVALAELGDAVRDRAAGRQHLLDATSTRDRLTLVLGLLDKHAARLTAFLLL